MVQSSARSVEPKTINIMSTNTIKHIILWGGLLLIGASLTLLKDKFPSHSIFVLDSIVILLVYLCNWFSFGTVFVPASSFSGKAVSLGVSIYTDFLYTLLAIAGIIIGILLLIPIEWQCIYQGAILLLAIVGIYTSSIAGARESAIHHASQQKGGSIDRIKAGSEQLLISATTSTGLDSIQKDRIRALTGRIKFISSNTSAIAASLDNEISTEFSRMTTLLESLPDTSTEFNAALERCDKLVTERIRRVTTP